MHKLLRFALVFFPALFCSCHLAITPARPSATPSPSATLTPAVTAILSKTPTPSPTPRPTAKRVVIISVDGLRPDGLLQAKIPRISGLINGGAFTRTARTIFPSGTLPAHASMVSGRCVSKHGIIWNDLIPSEEPLQGETVFSIAKEAGLRTIMVVGKEKLITLARPGTVDTFRFESESDEQIVQAALQEASGGFGVLFVHLILPDFYGHLTGWMSPDYFRGIGRDDTAVGALLDGLGALGLMDNTLLFLTADHGGHDFTHGTNQKEDMTIPWIVYGSGVLIGVPIDVPVSIMDTAATAVWGLGLGIPADWDGRPVVEAFGLRAEELSVATASPFHCGI